MTITVKKIGMLEQQPMTTQEGRRVTEDYLGLVGSVEVACSVRLGTLTLTINELRQLKQGQLLALTQKTHEPVDIVLNDQVIARGELMSCDDYFAVQITEITG